MTDLLKQKQEELKRLEKETVASHNALSLEIALKAVSENVPKQAVDYFFAERVESVELATADHVNWILGNRLQGGSHDKGTMATITLKDGVKIRWTFNQRRKGSLLLLVPGKKPNTLEPAFGRAYDYSDAEFIKKLNMNALIPLLGAEMAEKTEPFALAFSGLWFGALEAFLAAYVKSMQQCPVSSGKPPKVTLLREFWGEAIKRH